jgi:hypothetical protein
MTTLVDGGQGVRRPAPQVGKTHDPAFFEKAPRKPLRPLQAGRRTLTDLAERPLRTQALHESDFGSSQKAAKSGATTIAIR